MTWIIKTQFGKSRSASYSDIVKFAQSLPNYSEDNGIITCGAKQIREYIMYHTELEGLMQSVEKWKSNSQLQKQQEHDRRKIALCEKQQVRLIHINYDGPLTVEYIKSKVQ